MSTINTNGLDVNYPIPGVNNNSQGFRDNFTSIKNNLNIAASEISDLQNKAVLKSALANTVVNNDMANTLISNAAIRSFRSTTYNLGNALSGTVLVDVSLGDVQYGTVAGNVDISFGSWAPTGTQSNIQLQLAISNTEAVITFPSEVVFNNNNFGATTLENFANVGNTLTVTAPYGVTQLDYRLSTVDCGNTITIEPYNRPRQSTQIQQRIPASTGFQGDTTGAVCVDPSINQLYISNTTATTNLLTTSGSTDQLYTDMPLMFTGTSYGNVIIGGTYYVRNVFSSTQFTVSSSLGGPNVTLTTANAASSGALYANPVRNLYVCTEDYNATTSTKTVSATTVTTNYITLNNTTDLVVNQPILFSGSVFGGLEANTVYYIKSIASPNITVSKTRTNGVAGTEYPLSTASGPTFTATIYSGSDIWKSTQLLPIGTDASFSGNVSGNLYVQQNATVVGNTTLANVTVANLTATGNISGNVTAFNLTVSNLANFTSLSQLKIAGGTNGYFLQTDGTGNLGWVVGTATAASSTAAGANTQIQYNNGGSFAGTANLTWNNVSNTLTIGNALSVTGNTTVGNLTTSGNVVVGNLSTTAGFVSAPLFKNGTSNVGIVNNGNVSVSVSGNANIITITGTGANIAGTANISGNANVGNIGATNGVFTANISGVVNVTASANLQTTAGNVVSAKYLFTGVTTGITAAGTTQGAATALSTGFNVVSTVTGTNYGVSLPLSVAGMKVMVRNNSANVLYVWPPTSSAINTLATNGAYSMSANTTNEFYCTSSTQWYSLV